MSEDGELRYVLQSTLMPILRQPVVAIARNMVASQEQRARHAAVGRRGARYRASHRFSVINARSQIEYLVVDMDDANRQVRLSLRQADILQALTDDAALRKQGGGVPDINGTVPK